VREGRGVVGGMREGSRGYKKTLIGFSGGAGGRGCRWRWGKGCRRPTGGGSRGPTFVCGPFPPRIGRAGISGKAERALGARGQDQPFLSDLPPTDGAVSLPALLAEPAGA